MTPINKRKNIAAETVRGKECLQAADALLAQNFFADAISRAYYAAFHFATALLITKGIEAKSHAGLINRLSLFFIKSGIIAPKFGRVLSRAQKYREESDYSAAFVFTKEDASQCIADVRAFVGVAQKYLKRTRYL